MQVLELLLFIIPTYILSLSIYGYGYAFKNIFLKVEEDNLAIIGFYGVFLILVISYLTNIFFKHGEIHNLILFAVGIICLFGSKKFKNTLKINLIIFLFAIGFLIFKNHDDFSYYHFPYILNLIEDKLVIGIGHLNHGFRTPSSIFYLQSLTYLPHIEFYYLNFFMLFFLATVNLYFIYDINIKLYQEKFKPIILFNLISLLFINVKFYRLSEYGTDLVGQILLFVITSRLIYFISEKSVKKNNIYSILILTFFLITLKSYFILYLLILLIVLFHILKKENFAFVKKLLNFKLFLILFTLLIVHFKTNFFNTGCILYPISQTCFESFSWAVPKSSADAMSLWYEQWSKAGANPNYRVENPEIYVKNFNWLPNWIDSYFFNKVSDYLLSLAVLSLFFWVIFYKKDENSKEKFHYKSVLIIYLIIFLEWFFNHPALRYGGYGVSSCLVFLFIADTLKNRKFFEKKKIIFAIIFLSIALYNIRNINRLSDEFVKYNYNFLNDPRYEISEHHLRIKKQMIDIKKGINVQELKYKKINNYDIFYN